MARRLTQEEFIRGCTEIHKGKYDYSRVAYKNMRTKVTITCPIHGDFEQIADAHYRGKGCWLCYLNERRLGRDEFIKRAREVHGNKYDYSKVEYVNNNSKVCIICPIHGEFWQIPNCHLAGQGCIRCRRVVCYGIATNDLPRESTGEFANLWYGILDRCYSERELKKHPAYIGCSVSEEWWLLSNFKKWYNEHYVRGWQIDKDLLVKGNKVYGPDTCCFVPNEINATIVQRRKPKSTTLPQGVYLRKDGLFFAKFQCGGEKRRLGLYKTKEEAFLAFKEAKEAWVKTLADKYKDQLETKVYEALYKYEVEP